MSSPPSEQFLPNNAAVGFLEYVFFSHKHDVNRAADLATLALHAVLLSQELQLVGNMSQMLPQDWSKAEPVRLRYYKPQMNTKGEKLNIPPMEKDVILLCVTETAPNIIISISTSAKCVGHSLVIEETIKCPVNEARQKTRYQDAFCDPEGLLVELEGHLIHPLFDRSQALITSTSSGGKDSLNKGAEAEDMYTALADRRRAAQATRRGGGGGGGGRSPAGGNRPHFRPPPSFDYGRSDLDPFAGPSFNPGGMLLDPRHSGPMGMGPPDPHTGVPLPPGAVPPGARFDPFMPGMGRGGPMPRRGFPDPDGPGGFEDMYM